MGFVGGEIGYRILKRISPSGDSGYMDGSAYDNQSKTEALLGKEIWTEVRDCTVIDFGCGTGAEAVEVAQRGARQVIGLDIRESVLEQARRRAKDKGVADKCEFVTQTSEKADVILSLDSFEHFDDPAKMLQLMRDLLKDDGTVAASFGPTWYHPLGGHYFSVFPWAHFVFTEQALLRWRRDHKPDRPTKFSEIDGGLNGMTIRRFKRIVAASPFRFAQFEAVPIRRVKALHNRLTQEFLSAIVRCRLVPRERLQDG